MLPNNPFTVINLVVVMLFGVAFTVSASEEIFSGWGPFRGMNASPRLTEQDIEDMAKMKGNLLRINFNTWPLMKKEWPYEFDERAFLQLDQILYWCEQFGIGVVIDPHTTPGTSNHITTSYRDVLWKEYKWHDLLEKLWIKIASRYKDYGPVIAGYDLLNEPFVPDAAADSGPGSWNKLVRRLVKAIRSQDQRHTIIIEPAIHPTRGGGWISPVEGMNYLDPPPDTNTIYSLHIYHPDGFSHQGINGRPENVSYPGFVKGRYWDKAALKDALRPVVRYQKRYKVKIFIGEFSAPRWLGEAGNRYLRDLIEIFEDYHWSWAYHAYRSAPIWDAEMSNTDRNDLNRYPSTPRIELLKYFFKNNQLLIKSLPTQQSSQRIFSAQ